MTVSGGVTPDPNAGLVLTIGGRKVTPIYDTVRIEDAGDAARGTLDAEVSGNLADYPEMYDQALVTVHDWHAGAPMFMGFLTMRSQRRGADGTRIVLQATHIGNLIDDIWIPIENRPAETIQQRYGYFWGKYHGLYLSPDMSNVILANVTLAKQQFVNHTLRQLIDHCAVQYSTSTVSFIDNVGRPNFGALVGNAEGRAPVLTLAAAPYNINVDAPGAGEISPQDFEVTYDGSAYANTVRVNGATASGSMNVIDKAAVAAANGLVRWAVVDGASCKTQAQALTYANSWLAKSKAAAVRGSFRTTKDTGWQAGQSMTVTDAASGLAASVVYIARVNRRVLLGGAHPEIEYTIEFGRSRPWLRSD